MAAATALIVGGLAMGALGSAQQAKGEKIAGEFNALNSERNAELAREKAREDERQFRISMRKQAASNIAQVGASGVRLEGSPLEALRENARNAERDAIAIRMRGEAERNSYLREARASRDSAKSRSQGALLGGAGNLLSGLGGAF